jgi:Mlc titration factor MtfA (ptsG expression regulator)
MSQGDSRQRGVQISGIAWSCNYAATLVFPDDWFVRERVEKAIGVHMDLDVDALRQFCARDQDHVTLRY